MIGEKHETEKLKEQIAVFLSNREYQVAKSCFLECYKKRPDVLMEASDINGELRLCMQIISTCEFEEEAYGFCILDKLSDYQMLITHFRKLNAVVSSYLNGNANEEDLTFIKENAYITPVSLDIAAKLQGKECPEQIKLSL